MHVRGVGPQQPGALQGEIYALPAAVHHIGLDGIAHILVHVDVHIEQLGQVEVYFFIPEAEEPIADVGLHAGLLGIVKIGDGHGDVEQLGLEEPQEPGLLGGVVLLTTTHALHGLRFLRGDLRRFSSIGGLGVCCTVHQNWL